MDVQFREFNPFDVWIWLEFENRPAPIEKEYVEEVFYAWFYLGKLGGFNGENLQVMERGVDLSYLEYESEQMETVMMAPMHNMADFEYQHQWGRCWFDLGMSDPIALDVLINALGQLNKDHVTIKQLIFGGENEDWPVQKESQAILQ